MRAKLQGLFERCQAQKHITLVGLSLPQRPSLWLSVTMRAKLQGLFRALPGPETHHPGGVESAPTPLTLVVGHDESQAPWAFSSVAKPRNTPPWRGKFQPNSPHSGCWSIFVNTYPQASRVWVPPLGPFPDPISLSLPHFWRFSTAWYGTVRYSTVHFWGVFHWVLYLVPDTFLVPLRSRFHRAVPLPKRDVKTLLITDWPEKIVITVTELATRDPPLQLDPLDLNQHSQRRIGRNFCLNKRTFLHQPQNSSVVVCWGSSDVPLVDSRGADPARSWWHDAEGKSLMYNVTFELAIFSEYVFCLYFYLCICVLLQLKTIWSNKCTSRLYWICIIVWARNEPLEKDKWLMPRL